MLIGRKTNNIDTLRISDMFWTSGENSTCTYWAWATALTHDLEYEDREPAIDEVSRGIKRILLESLDMWQENYPARAQVLLRALIHMSQRCPDDQTTEYLVNQLKINRFPARIGMDADYCSNKLIKSIGFPFRDFEEIKQHIIIGLKGLRGGDIHAVNLTVKNPSIIWRPNKLSLWSMQICIYGDITQYPCTGIDGGTALGTVEDQQIASYILRLRDFTGWCRQQ